MSGSGGAAEALLSYETLVHAVAGAMGSVTAMTVFFPLDTARIRLQVDENRKSKSTPVILSEIAKEEGIMSLYRGWFPVISSLCCSNFVYFYTFNFLKKVMIHDKRQSRPGKDLVMGFISGAVNVLLTTPMWVVNTRLKLQGAKFRNEELHQTHYKGIFDAFSQIIANEGVGTLWNGTLPSLVLVFNPAVQFMFYEAMKRKAGRGGRRVSSVEIFLIGAIAKAIATTATYPLQTVQAILRFGQYKSHEKGGLMGSVRNVVDLLMDRIKRNGVIGLYKGLEAKLLQTVLTAALMFVVYEKIAAVTFRMMGINKKLKH
ncbi:peroxisomal membrane protein PMP34 [Astyanax mexicanus]|uniref:Peroxisomal membrane protein PMP34-like n=2 Tax=Astyanax mexicanus TaxID=7994 RepID=A0A8T2L2X6_ASTMX|nr:peroxisomal membrane protein PMP34 [Astyanax mexicanus]KAG9264385.1 peroxisomal membrane protein PMP34-like [Astyanax mexicanus]